MSVLPIALAMLCGFCLTVLIGSAFLAYVWVKASPSGYHSLLLIAVIVSLFAVSPVQAQDTITVCRIDKLARWDGAFAVLEQQLERVTPAEITSAVNAQDCDVTVFIMAQPRTCNGYPEALGCASNGRVYLVDGMEAYPAALLHEVLHALGYAGHNEDVTSVMYHDFWPVSHLTAYGDGDIAALRALVGQ